MTSVAKKAHEICNLESKGESAVPKQAIEWQEVPQFGVSGTVGMFSEFHAIVFVPEHKHSKEEIPEIIQELDSLLTALTGMPLITDTPVPARTILMTKCNGTCEGKCNEYELYGDLRTEFEAVFHEGRDACIALAEKLKEGQSEVVQAFAERQMMADRPHLHA